MSLTSSFQEMHLIRITKWGKWNVSLVGGWSDCTILRPQQLKCSTPKMKVRSSTACFIVLVAAWQPLSSRTWSRKTLVPVWWLGDAWMPKNQTQTTTEPSALVVQGNECFRWNAPWFDCMFLMCKSAFDENSTLCKQRSPVCHHEYNHYSPYCLWKRNLQGKYFCPLLKCIS